MTTGIEQVKVTQRMAIEAMSSYAEAHLAEKKAKATKASLSKAIIKPYLTANPNDTLYDGETGLEASLQPHSAPRWFDYKDIPAELMEWAVQRSLLVPALGAIDKLVKEAENEDQQLASGAKRFVDAIKPGGTGSPRLTVSKREE